MPHKLHHKKLWTHDPPNRGDIHEVIPPEPESVEIPMTHNHEKGPPPTTEGIQIVTDAPTNTNPLAPRADPKPQRYKTVKDPKSATKGDDGGRAVITRSSQSHIKTKCKILLNETTPRGYIWILFYLGPCRKTFV